MPRDTVPIVALVATLTLSNPGAYQPATALTFQLAVRDSGGSFVPDLAPVDFEVRVDGVVRQAEVSRPSARGITVLLLVDMSFSHTLGLSGVLSPQGELIRAIESDLLGSLSPLDRLRIGRFANRQVSLHERFLSGRREQSAVVRTFLDVRTMPAEDWFGSSPIWDAVASVAQVLGSEPGPRGLVVVTDGKASGNYLSMEDAAWEAARRAVPVSVLYQRERHGVGFRPEHDSERVLRPLADLTGGLFRLNDAFTRARWRGTPPLYEPFVDFLRHSYHVRLPLDDRRPGRRHLEVRVARRGLHVHAPRWIEMAPVLSGETY